MQIQHWTSKKIGLLLAGILIVLGCCVAILNYPLGPDEKYLTPYCEPLPSTFSVKDLVGTWVAKYSGGDLVDKHQISTNGTYKQTFFIQGEIDFESDWQEWGIEYHEDGYALLHLQGMRRCDGTLDQCNDPGGGLPEGDIVVNICDGTPMSYTDEVILFVTGSSSTPRGIKLIHARAAGSEWTYSFQLEK